MPLSIQWRTTQANATLHERLQPHKRNGKHSAFQGGELTVTKLFLQLRAETATPADLKAHKRAGWFSTSGS